MFRVQNHLANELLQQHGVFVTRKATRAGCTMSLVKACCQAGKKVAVFSPTIRILRQIDEIIPKITRSAARIAPILSNPELCAKLEPNPQLKFQFKEDCSDCEYRGKPKQCVFEDLLINEFGVYCLTYAKLQSLQKSKSKYSKLLLGKLQNCDVFIFDEFTTAVVNEIPTIVMTETDDKGTVFRIKEQLRAVFKEEFEYSDMIVSKGIYEESVRMQMESGFWGVTIDEFLSHILRKSSQSLPSKIGTHLAFFHVNSEDLELHES